MIATTMKPLDIRNREKRRLDQIYLNKKNKRAKRQEELEKQEKRFHARVQSAIAAKFEEQKLS